MADILQELLEEQKNLRPEIKKKNHRSMSIKNFDISKLSMDLETQEDGVKKKKKKKTSKRDISSRKKELSTTVEKCKESAKARKKKLEDAEKTIEQLQQNIDQLSTAQKEREEQTTVATKEKIQKLKNTIKSQDDYIEAQTITIKKLVNIIQRDDYSIDHDGDRTPPREDSDQENSSSF